MKKKAQNRKSEQYTPQDTQLGTEFKVIIVSMVVRPFRHISLTLLDYINLDGMVDALVKKIQSQLLGSDTSCAQTNAPWLGMVKYLHIINVDDCSSSLSLTGTTTNGKVTFTKVSIGDLSKKVSPPRTRFAKQVLLEPFAILRTNLQG
jgi:hypothetical protein